MPFRWNFRKRRKRRKGGGGWSWGSKISFSRFCQKRAWLLFPETFPSPPHPAVFWLLSWDFLERGFGPLMRMFNRKMGRMEEEKEENDQIKSQLSLIFKYISRRETILNNPKQNHLQATLNNGDQNDDAAWRLTFLIASFHPSPAHLTSFTSWRWCWRWLYSCLIF